MTTAYDNLNAILALIVDNAYAYDATGNPVYQRKLNALVRIFNREYETLQNAGFVPIDWTMNA